MVSSPVAHGDDRYLSKSLDHWSLTLIWCRLWDYLRRSGAAGSVKILDSASCSCLPSCFDWLDLWNRFFIPLSGGIDSCATAVICPRPLERPYNWQSSVLFSACVDSSTLLFMLPTRIQQRKLRSPKIAEEYVLKMTIGSLKVLKTFVASCSVLLCKLIHESTPWNLKSKLTKDCSLGTENSSKETRLRAKELVG